MKYISLPKARFRRWKLKEKIILKKWASRQYTSLNKTKKAYTLKLNWIIPFQRWSIEVITTNISSKKDLFCTNGFNTLKRKNVLSEFCFNLFVRLCIRLDSTKLRIIPEKTNSKIKEKGIVDKLRSWVDELHCEMLCIAGKKLSLKIITMIMPNRSHRLTKWRTIMISSWIRFVSIRFVVWFVVHSLIKNKLV